MNRSKKTGTAAETAIVNWLRRNGYEEARRLPLTGSGDIGDIDLGILFGVVLQVKAGRAAEKASDAQIELWSKQAREQAARSGSQLGLLVTKRAGFGELRVDSWWMHYRLKPGIPARSRLSYLSTLLTSGLAV